jgi:XTP/dITP diphosphohydrolase
MNIIFVTGNKYKFSIAKKALIGLDVKLLQRKIETPEIQSMDVCEIASFSAEWASAKLKKAVVVTDAGFYFVALNGFPGPLIKHVDKCFSADDYIRLMEGYKNRKVIVKECLAFSIPGKKTITFVSKTEGNIALRPCGKGISSIDKVFIPKGYNRATAEMEMNEMLEFWKIKINCWQKLVGYLKSKN